jgi:hypothetical protein
MYFSLYILSSALAIQWSEEKSGCSALIKLNMGKRIALPFTFSFTGNSIPEISLLKMAFELMGLVSLKKI